jgi:predicted Rossmann-fold nucleotide-binding protein
MRDNVIATGGGSSLMAANRGAADAEALIGFNVVLAKEQPAELLFDLRTDVSLPVFRNPPPACRHVSWRLWHARRNV